MRKRLVSIGLFVAATLLFVAAPSADPGGIEGPWQQVETNAGACPTCWIEIARKGGSLAVTASNGWSASLDPGGRTGTGVWSAENRGWVSGRPFALTLRPADRRLHMEMRVEMPDGSRRFIRAVFERAWLGA